VFALPRVQLAVVAMLISQTVMVVLMVMTPLYMHHHQHTDATVLSVLSAHTLGMFGLAAVTGYLIDRIGRVPMLVAGALTLILSALLAPLSTHELVLAVALFLLGRAGTSATSPDRRCWQTPCAARRKACSGLNDGLVAFAAGIGSLGAGPLFASGGYLAVSVAGLALTVVLLGLIYRLSRPQLEVKAASGLD
jgi:MFS family permease